jgi:protein-disulfide isomerase
MPLPRRSLRALVLVTLLGGGAYGVACARSKDGNAAPAADAGPKTAAVVGAPAGTDSVSARADRGRIQGSASAPVWVVEVSDFQCPYCRMWHDSTYPALVREYVETGKARLAYVNFPLPSHRNAWPAAEAAMCSGVQGKFWAMHDKLFSTQGTWAALADPTAFFDSLAATAGVEAPKMRACVSSHATRPLIQADVDRATAAGINSTPNFIIGDRPIVGAQPIEVFRQAIDSALAKK